MLASNVTVSMPILGGALYLMGETAILFGTLRRQIHSGMLSRRTRLVGTILPALFFVLLLALITVYPISLASADFWRLAGIVLCIVIRPGITRYVLERSLLSHQKTGRIFLRVCGVQLAFLPFLLLMLLLSPLPRYTVWALLGGYVVSGVLESFPLDRMGDRLYALTEEDQAELNALQGAHAFKMFQRIMLVVAAALQVTQVMIYTYIAVSADALIVSMAIALLCTYVSFIAMDALLRRQRARAADPNFLLMAGLVIWLYGLALFIRSLDAPSPASGYFTLAMCTMGATACVRVLMSMEADMRRVAAFTTGHAPGKAMDMIQAVRVEISSLAGQMTALVGLTLICIFTSTDFPNDWDTAFRSFSPLLTLPALLLVGAAILFALGFPLTRQHMDKLRRYTELQQQGLENAPLRDQLEAVVVRRSLKRYGIKAILLVLRPLYYHKIIGKEKIRLDKDIPCVFVCNHGEIYGPVVSTLYVPFSFRPWVAYEMTDRQAIVDRTMNGAFQDAKGTWRKFLHWMMVHMGAPFLAWAMKSVDCIPVYHDNPRKLIQTFRETTATMQAGDNILLFPENAETSANHRYAREGVSEFFTGFTMIGQLYNSKTGKCPLFIPIYANRKKRTVTFGVPIRYNPDLPAGEEKERLCKHLRNEMLKIAGLDGNEKEGTPDEAGENHRNADHPVS